jgi:predicted enzyme related to lactoylglutathione lyase
MPSVRRLKTSYDKDLVILAAITRANWGSGPSGINGGVGPSNDGGKRASVYAQVSDLQGTLDKAETLGGKTVLAPTKVPGGPKPAMFADPAGNITGLMLGGKCS